MPDAESGANTQQAAAEAQTAAALLTTLANEGQEQHRESNTGVADAGATRSAQIAVDVRGRRFTVSYGQTTTFADLMAKVQPKLDAATRARAHAHAPAPAAAAHAAADCATTATSNDNADAVDVSANAASPPQAAAAAAAPVLESLALPGGVDVDQDDAVAPLIAHIPGNIPGTDTPPGSGGVGTAAVLVLLANCAGDAPGECTLPDPGPAEGEAETTEPAVPTAADPAVSAGPGPGVPALQRCHTCHPHDGAVHDDRSRGHHADHAGVDGGRIDVTAAMGSNKRRGSSLDPVNPRAHAADGGSEAASVAQRRRQSKAPAPRATGSGVSREPDAKAAQGCSAEGGGV